MVASQFVESACHVASRSTSSISARRSPILFTGFCLDSSSPQNLCQSWFGLEALSDIAHYPSQTSTSNLIQSTIHSCTMPHPQKGRSRPRGSDEEFVLFLQGVSVLRQVGFPDGCLTEETDSSPLSLARTEGSGTPNSLAHPTSRGIR